MKMSEKRNLGEVLRSLPKDKLAEVLGQLSEKEANEIIYDWSIWARESQKYSLHDPYNLTMYMAGRGLIF